MREKYGLFGTSSEDTILWRVDSVPTVCSSLAGGTRYGCDLGHVCMSRQRVQLMVLSCWSCSHPFSCSPCSPKRSVHTEDAQMS